MQPLPARTLPAAPLTPTVGLIGLCSPLEVGADHAPGLVAALDSWLTSAGVRTVNAGVPHSADDAAQTGRLLAGSHVDAVLGVSASWFEDYLVLDLLEECPAPLLLWSTPGMETGALCGVQQLTCFLKQLGAPFTCVFGALDDPACRERALSSVRAAALHARLRRARIGLAGHRVAGMTHTSPNEFMLKRAIGARVVPLDLPAILRDAAAVTAEITRPLWEGICAHSGECHVPEADGLDSMAVYATVRNLVLTHGLDALTVGCYPDLMGRVCLAASLLADEGVPLACEGDVNGAVGQLILQLLTAQPTHNTDWLNPLDDGTVVLTHCGSGSLSLAADPSAIALRDVRLMGQGACALFAARPGPVTLISLNPTAAGYQCALLEGEAVPTEMVFPGNPVRVQFAQPTHTLIEWIHAEGIGHHWMIGYGHIAQTLRDWARIAGPSLRLVEP